MRGSAALRALADVTGHRPVELACRQQICSQAPAVVETLQGLLCQTPVLTQPPSLRDTCAPTLGHTDLRAPLLPPSGTCPLLAASSASSHAAEDTSAKAWELRAGVSRAPVSLSLSQSSTSHGFIVVEKERSFAGLGSSET